MERGRHFHDFYAPVDGVARKFSMRCDGGVPAWLCIAEHLEGPLYTVELFELVNACNTLLKKGLPWGALAVHRAGAIGAVIEAAENRRAEIYGPLESAA